MWRLRTTVILSLLALAIGIGGTHWLSGRSTDEPLALSAVSTRRLPPPHHRTTPAAHHARAVALHAHNGSKNLPVAARLPAQSQPDLAARAAPPELVPLDMPVVRDEAYEQQLGHLDGRVVMRVSIDGAGHVSAANVVETSGDAALDAHALRSVRQWRFAVPTDYPEGFSADLPMRFSSHDEPMASVP
jgi:protein TonB